jgi:hypothetical protein
MILSEFWKELEDILDRSSYIEVIFSRFDSYNAFFLFEYILDNSEYVRHVVTIGPDAELDSILDYVRKNKGIKRKSPVVDKI